MSEITEEKVRIFKSACKKISIYYQGVEITNEKMVQQYIEFLQENMFAEKHNVMITMHNGSKLYDVINLVCYVLAIVSMNNLDFDVIEENLERGQVYTYEDKQERIEYIEFEESIGRYVFQRKAGTYMILKNGFADLIPYYGNAKTLGTIGAGDQHTSLEFQKKVLNVESERATSYVDTSVVIVTEHNYFTDLLNDIVIRYGKCEYKITDIIAVSFFTDENEVPYAGNANRIEANIKITNNMSTARNLLFQRNGNEVIGFSIFGLKGVKNTVGELEEALKRKKLSFSAVSYDIGDDVDGLFGLIGDENVSNPKVYACTKDFLLSHYLGIDSKYEVFKEYDYECNRIVDKEIKYKIVDSAIKWKELIRVYDTLRELRKIMEGDENTEKFVIESYGLMRLMLSSVVPLKEYEDKSDIDVDYVTPSEKLESIMNYKSLTDNVSAYVNKIQSFISEIYRMLYDANPKSDYLRQNINRSVRTTIIVDKAYYKPIILRYYAKRGLANAFSVYTERRAKEEPFDDMFIVGKMDNLNLINWNNALQQNYVLYEAEYRLFAWNLKRYQEKISLLNQLSYYHVYEEEMFVDEMNEVDEVVNNVITEMDEINKLEEDFVIQNAILHSSHFASETNSIPAEITRVAACDTGESIYLTKYYKAFVLDIDRKAVKEVETKDIKSGDSLIFTVNNGKTKDIAELVLAKFAQNSKDDNLEKAISYVSEWKDSLIRIKEDNNFKYTDMSRLFKQVGYSATGQAIRSWIDQDCHVVGPMNDEAYGAMATIFDMYGTCDDFVHDVKKYIEATQLVRRQRTAILNVIANVIVAKYTKSSITLDKSFDGVITEEIMNFSVVKRISQIKDVEEFTVPNSKANKPILV